MASSLVQPQSHVPEHGTNVPTEASTVAVEPVNPGDAAVTVMVPGPVAWTSAKASPWYASRTLPRNVDCVMLALSTARSVPGPLRVNVTVAAEVVTTPPAPSEIAALTNETSFRSVSTVAWSAVRTISVALVPVGAGAVDWNFLTHLPKPVGENGGGMANAIVGSIVLVALAVLLGVPVGTPRLPYVELDESEFSVIRALLERRGLLAHAA